MIYYSRRMLIRILFLSFGTPFIVIFTILPPLWKKTSLCYKWQIWLQITDKIWHKFARFLLLEISLLYLDTPKKFHNPSNKTISMFIILYGATISDDWYSLKALLWSHYVFFVILVVAAPARSYSNQNSLMMFIIYICPFRVCSTELVDNSECEHVCGSPERVESAVSSSTCNCQAFDFICLIKW